ncbi:hypothetical protein VTK26DRAFT_6950 [Humicola hyalothermophila]
METVIQDHTPLADYLKDEGEAQEAWATPSSSEHHDDSPPGSPSFAPVGRPMVKKRFRNKLPDRLPLDVPRIDRLSSLRHSYSKAVASRIDRRDNRKFIEQFRYTIVASQLLSGHSIAGQHSYSSRQKDTAEAQETAPTTPTGLLVTAAAALVVALVVKWVYSGGYVHLTKKRVGFTAIMLVAVASVSHVYLRQQWLRYLKNQALAEVKTFVSRSQDFDSASSAALSLIQEVELVSRGYRISAPLPPISRIEDRSQTRRCSRLRKALKGQFSDMIQNYMQVSSAIKEFAEEVNVEKYHDIYDISDFDISDAMQGFSEKEFDDPESLRSLKIAASRFHTIRKLLLCTLLAFEPTGDNTDFLRWSTAAEGLKTLNTVTTQSFDRLSRILTEGESFLTIPDTKMPLSPGREKRRSQFMKLNSLSTGIRGLQAKLALLREESEKTLNEAEDLSELGPSLMAQYESIGQDLKMLTHAWEEGKAALASGIDRNEKRLSSISTLLSPASSLSGLTTVEEGGALEAFKALTGESPRSSSFESAKGDSDEAEVFEAVSLPSRPRSLLTREERIAKMREDREKREIARERAEANRAMLEARLEQASILKKVVDAIKDLVQDCNFDCNDSGIALQAMDNSHVALVSMMLKAEGFSPFRCDRNIALGVNLTSLTKVLRAAQNEDILTLKAEDAPDVLNLVFESSETDRISEYDLKLMDIDQEHLGIPDTEYAATITMPAAEFKRITTDLMAINESVTIEASKDGVKFSCQGDIGNGSVTLRQHSNVDKPSESIEIELSEPVSLTFSLKYLVNFCKASALSNTVKICLSNEVPLLVEYSLAGSSYLRFYLAPKIGDEE